MSRIHSTYHPADRQATPPFSSGGHRLDANLHLYYEKKLLITTEKRLVLAPLGVQQKLPKGFGTEVKWLRYKTLAGSTNQLTEGVPPTASQIETENVSASIRQYGQFVKTSELLSMVAIDPVLKNMSERLGWAASKTIESLCVAELDSAATLRRVNGRANDISIVAGDVINHKEIIQDIVLKKAAGIEAHEKGNFVVVLNPFSEYDIVTSTDAGAFLDIHKYTDNKNILSGEIGRMYNARFLVSDLMTTQAGVGGAGIDVHSSYVFGNQAFGVVKLDSKSFEMFIKQPGSAGTADPLNQVATVGYKLVGFAVKYLEAGVRRCTRIKSSSAIA